MKLFCLDLTKVNILVVTLDYQFCHIGYTRWRMQAFSLCSLLQLHVSLYDLKIKSGLKNSFFCSKLRPSSAI